jgi:ABC-type bacteriocin/lantibiotic exporter with double-glycine peptidase domain
MSAHSMSTPHARRAVVALCALLALGCRAQTIRPEQLSEHAVTLDLPLVEQDALHECGLAALSALCQYWGIAIPPEERAALARTADEMQGLSGGELRAALDRRGMESFLFKGALDRSTTGLYRQIDEGRPAIVMVAPDDEARHYVLVLGYDEPRGNLLLLDPARGQVLVSATEFERRWARCERFTLLACPRVGPEPVAHDLRPSSSTRVSSKGIDG